MHTPGYRHLKTALVFMIALFAFQSSSIAAETSFNKLPGRWVGTGWLQMPSGDKETIRCTATYFVKNGGKNLNQNLRCASASYTVVSKGALTSNGGKITGSWREETFDMKGNVSGTATRDVLKLMVKGDGYTAKFSIKTKGARQSVVITTNGGNIKKLVINLRKG